MPFSLNSPTLTSSSSSSTSTSKATRDPPIGRASTSTSAPTARAPSISVSPSITNVVPSSNTSSAALKRAMVPSNSSLSDSSSIFAASRSKLYLTSTKSPTTMGSSILVAGVTSMVTSPSSRLSMVMVPEPSVTSKAVTNPFIFINGPSTPAP